MSVFVGIQEVKDYDHWRESFDEDNAKREEAGITVVSVTRGHTNPNEVCVIMEASDAAIAHGFSTSPELGEKMEAAGVLPGGRLFVGAN